MKKKFMTSFAAISAGFAVSQAEAAIEPQTTIDATALNVATAGAGIPSPNTTRAATTLEDKDFIIRRAGPNGTMVADHWSHASHESHESHASHASHYSSRY